MSLIGRDIYEATALRRLLSVAEPEPDVPAAAFERPAELPDHAAVRRFPRPRSPAAAGPGRDEPERRAR